MDKQQLVIYNNVIINIYIDLIVLKKKLGYSFWFLLNQFLHSDRGVCCRETHRRCKNPTAGRGTTESDWV